MKYYWTLFFSAFVLSHAITDSSNYKIIQLLYEKIKNSYEDIPEVSVSNVKILSKENLIIVDVRKNVEKLFPLYLEPLAF